MAASKRSPTAPVRAVWSFKRCLNRNQVEVPRVVRRGAARDAQVVVAPRAQVAAVAAVVRVARVVAAEAVVVAVAAVVAAAVEAVVVAADLAVVRAVAVVARAAQAVVRVALEVPAVAKAMRAGPGTAAPAVPLRAAVAKVAICWKMSLRSIEWRKS
jgi:hypothetical protein